MTHPDLQALIDSLLPFAQSLLSKHGDFHPFGAIMASDGGVQWIAAATGEESPSGQIPIDMTTESIKAMAAAEEVRAATICYDARTIPPGATAKADVIAFSLECLLGESIGAFLPHESGDDGEIEYGEMFVTQKARQFFSSASAAD